MGKSVANPSTGTAKNASNYISVYISVSDRCSENRMPDRVFEMRCGSSCLCFLSGLWGFFLGKPSDEHFARYIVPLRFHIAGGMGALLAGPWQFSEGLRNRALEFTVGLDVSTCCPSPSAQLQDSLWATVSMEGLATHLGFGTLAVLWFATAVQAYRNALKGEIDLHRR
jgi:hypothetical protein